MRVTFNQLKVFESVARRRSFSRAAEELFLTQPTVSIQIKQLTETVGMPLFEQIGKKIFLTDAGEQLAVTCSELSEVWSRFEMTVADLKGIKTGKLRLAAVTTAKYFVPRLLGPFCEQFPGVDLALEVGNRNTIIERLSKNQDDLYVMGMPPRHLAIKQHRFLANPLVVIAPYSHPLRKRAKIELQELSKERFILREVGSGTRLAAERYLKAHGMKFTKTMELGSNEAIKQAVAGGLGLSILSLHALGPDSAPRSLVALNCEGLPIRRHWYIVHPKGKRLSVVAQAFFAFLKAEGGRIKLPSLAGFSGHGGTVQRA
jgi:DNA-binding transcriptional LysR family regulator